MITQSHLNSAARKALAFLESQEDIKEAEAFISANGVLHTRLNYTSHIPCNGLEEPKSVENFGVGVQAVFTPTKGDNDYRIGFGSEASDISLSGVEAALNKARQGAVIDPEFN